VFVYGEAMNAQTRPRSRGTKAILTREAIASAALAALAQGGPGGLTMRKVAALLDTGPSSLYAHVKNLEDLQGLVLDEMSTTIDVAPASAEPDPVSAIVTLMQAYAAALRQHPGTAAVALSAPPVGPGFLDFAEAFATRLDAMGVGAAETLGTFDKLVLLVTATVAEQEASFRIDPTVSIGDRYADVLAAQPADAPARPLLRALLATGQPSPDDITWTVTTFLRGSWRR
jgi:AcrR family transcriptional regulator